MKHVILLVFALVYASTAFSQVSLSEVTIELDQIVRDIAQAGSLGFDRDAQYKRFMKLNEVASEEELVILTDHQSPAVRGYAFWALAKRNYAELQDIFIAHVHDKAPVFQKNGCMVGNESVISFMRQVVTPYMYDPNCKKLDDATRALVQ